MIDALCHLTRAAALLGFEPAPSAVDAPLTALEGSALVSRFRYWQGVSGRRYLFSVFPLRSDGSPDICPRYQEAVLLVVSRKPDGVRRIVWAGQTGVMPDLIFDGEVMRNALSFGANEVHLHLLTSDNDARVAMIRDIVG